MTQAYYYWHQSRRRLRHCLDEIYLVEANLAIKHQLSLKISHWQAQRVQAITLQNHHSWTNGREHCTRLFYVWEALRKWSKLSETNLTWSFDIFTFPRKRKDHSSHRWCSRALKEHFSHTCCFLTPLMFYFTFQAKNLQLQQLLDYYFFYHLILHGQVFL